MGENALLHHLADGRLRMGWAALEGHQVRAGDLLFEMELLSEEGVEVDFASLALGSMSEIADPLAQTIDGATLIMPRLSTKALPMEGLQLWPNPARDVLNLQWTLESGVRSWSVEMVDALGRVVTSDHKAVSGGELGARLGLEGVPSGTYQVRLQWMDASGTSKSLLRRLQVQR
jgi:hypothetical protein